MEERVTVIEMSLERQGADIQALIEAHDKLARGAEATRRKVYRDDEVKGPPGASAPAESMDQTLARMNPGDPPPAGLS